MPERVSRASRVEIVLLLALLAWAMFPVVLLLVHAGQIHARFTGADGLIGADGVLGADQLQYLAWARDAGSHLLASDLFTLAPSGHVYLEPLFTITGLLAQIGVSLQLAYLLWKPIAALALFAAAVAWGRRAFAGRVAARAGVVTLALFMYLPLTALFSWTNSGPGPFRFQMYLLASELLGSNKLWGYVPSAFGLALVPVALLAVERALDLKAGRDHATRAGRAGVDRRPLMLAALACALASWLHPWQGVTLIVIFVGLAVWRRLRNVLALSVPALAAALPLVYYYLLSHTDPAWKLASRYEVVSRLPPLVLLAGLGPIVVIAALGLRRPGEQVFEQALLLWIAASFVTYFANDAFASHALQGLSFPLAVLAVRGWRRMRLAPFLGALAVALATVPGLAYDARKFADTARNSKLVQYYLPAGDQRALDWVAADAPPGGVLAPTPFAVVVPSQTGRNVWVGHGYWSRDYFSRAKQVKALFRGHLRPAGAAQRFVRASGATLLISDCAHHADLTRALAPLLASVHQFGCARVYVLSRAP